MGRPKKSIDPEEVAEAIGEAVSSIDPNAERLAYLHALYQTLKEEGIRSISDLENKISALQ